MIISEELATNPFNETGDPEQDTSIVTIKYSSLSLDDQNMIVNVTREYPFDYAVVMFGYIMPFVLLLTFVTNTLVVMVLAQKHMRSPTNTVLFTMAIVDLMTLISPSPWYFYIYTLGYNDKFLYPPNLCYAHHVMTDVIPVYFHTSSTWLALLLASQRYIYVCHPTLASTWCTVPKVKKAIMIILTVALLHQLSRLFDNTFIPIRIQYDTYETLACKLTISDWVIKFDVAIFYTSYFIFRILFVFIIPIVALITLNCLLFRALKQAENKRTELLKARYSARKSSKEFKRVKSPNNRTFFRKNRDNSIITSQYYNQGESTGCQSTFNCHNDKQRQLSAQGSTGNNYIGKYTTQTYKNERGPKAKNFRKNIYSRFRKRRNTFNNNNNEVGINQRNRPVENSSSNIHSLSDVTRLTNCSATFFIGENPLPTSPTDSVSNEKSLENYQKTMSQESENNMDSCSLSTSNISKDNSGKTISGGKQKHSSSREYDESAEANDDYFCLTVCTSCEHNDCQKCNDLRRGSTSHGRPVRKGEAGSILEGNQADSQCSSSVATTNSTTNEDGSSFFGFHPQSSSVCAAQASFDASENAAKLDNETENLSGTKTDIHGDKTKSGGNKATKRLPCGCSTTVDTLKGNNLSRHSRKVECQNYIKGCKSLGGRFSLMRVSKLGLKPKHSATNSCSNSDPCINSGENVSFDASAKVNNATAHKRPYQDDKNVNNTKETRVVREKDGLSYRTMPLSRSDYGDCPKRTSDGGNTTATTKNTTECEAITTTTNVTTATVTTTTTLVSANTTSISSMVKFPHLLVGKDTGKHPQHIGPDYPGRQSGIASTTTKSRLSRGTISGYNQYVSAANTNPTMRSMDSHRTTLMLIVVVSVFLIVEVPAAVMTIIHVASNLLFTSEDSTVIEPNKYIKLFINFVIMISYSVNFTIYCSMSKKFRETFRELFLCNKSSNRSNDPSSKHKPNQAQELHKLGRRQTQSQLIMFSELPSTIVKDGNHNEDDGKNNDSTRS